MLSPRPCPRQMWPQVQASVQHTYFLHVCVLFLVGRAPSFYQGSLSFVYCHFKSYSWFHFPDSIDGATSASQLAFELIEQISGVFNKTGTLVKKIAEISDYDEIHEHGDMVSVGTLGGISYSDPRRLGDWATT